MKIIVLGTHGQFNIGDELLLETFLSQLGNGHQYVVNSYNPTFTQNAMCPKFNVESFHTTREFPRFLIHLLTCDLLFFDGGSIIKELYASVGRNPYSTLLMILVSVIFAKLIARIRVVMSNVGVGPIITHRGEQLARRILNQVDILSVRDEKSLQIALKLGLSPNKVILVPDAVFINQPDIFVPNPKPFPPSEKIRVALNLNYDIENRDAWEPFLANLAASLTQLNDAKKIEIYALPMQSKFKINDDLSMLKEFSKRISHIPFIVYDPQTAQEAAQLMQCMDMVLAERLHTLVISAILGKPFFGLIYDVKVKEMIGYLGMSEHSININQPFTAKELTDGINHLLDNREQVSVHLLKRSTELREQLIKYFDEIHQKFI